VVVKSGEICFLPLETKKTDFLLKFSNSFLFPTLMIVCRKTFVPHH